MNARRRPESDGPCRTVCCSGSGATIVTNGRKPFHRG